MKKTNMNIFRTLAITLLLMVGSVAAYAQLAENRLSVPLCWRSVQQTVQLPILMVILH